MLILVWKCPVLCDKVQAKVQYTDHRITTYMQQKRNYWKLTLKTSIKFYLDKLLLIFLLCLARSYCLETIYIKYFLHLNIFKGRKMQSIVIRERKKTRQSCSDDILWNCSRINIKKVPVKRRKVVKNIKVSDTIVRIVDSRCTETVRMRRSYHSCIGCQQLLSYNAS